MTPVSRYLLAATAVSSIFLSGCGAGFQAGPVSSPIGAIKGRVHGGQPPVGSSKVYILQPGVGAYAGPGIAASTANVSISLLTGTGISTDNIGGYVTTDSNGFFTITGDYNCTAGLPVYAYALGGDAGGGTNTGIGMMAILGICPSGGGDLSATVPYLWINEVTTIAAAYSMSGFATDPTHVSIGPTGSASAASTLATTGIANAFATSGNLVNIGNGTALTTTPAGNGTVPTAKINTLANILASCVNATDAAFANCTTLFGAATGTTNATTPTDTAIAAINIAHAPATGVTALYGLQAGVATPFPAALTKQPNDFTLSVYYTGTGVNAISYVASHQLAIDAAGNIWVASDSSTVNALSGFNALGAPLAGSPFTGNGLGVPNAVAIDAASQNVWVTNNSAATLSEFTTAGAAVGTVTPYTTGTTKALSGPSDLAFDGTGNIWVNNYTSGAVVKLTSAGAFTATAANTTYLKSSEGIAISPSGSVWAVGASKAYGTLWTSADALSTEKATPYYADGIAVDASGNAWIANYRTDLSVLNPTATTVTSYTPGASDYYVPEYYALAIDGSSNIILADWSNGMIEKYSNTGTNLSGTFGYEPADEPAAGYTPSSSVAPPTGYIEPFNVAVDGSGNIWFSCETAVLQQMIGAATPVATPLAYGVANSLLGTRP